MDRLTWISILPDPDFFGAGHKRHTEILFPEINRHIVLEYLAAKK